MPFVADASATLPWCFEDEATAWSESLLDRLSAGEQVIVPAHWPIEFSNALLMAVRRKRITPEKAEWFLERLAALHITIEPTLPLGHIKPVFDLSVKHNLTFYDAMYLDLAKRTGLPLATLDGDLLKTAPLESVPLVV